MSHHHDHDHGQDHGHDHGHDHSHDHNHGRDHSHGHDHGHQAAAPMTDMEKLPHLLAHWRAHNDEHAANYRSWAARADQAGQKDAARFLSQAADDTDKISKLFEDAKAALK